MSEKSVSVQRAVTVPKNLMRAVALDRFGGPEVLVVRSISVPEPKPDQILIQIQSAGVGI